MPVRFSAVALLVTAAIVSLVPWAGRGLADEPAAGDNGPLKPTAALAQFRLPEDLKIELVAAEPNVVDPVAIRFDELGHLWVVEMRDYPTGPTPEGKQTSRIRLLEDKDGDGLYEKATLFADNRSFVTGLQPWKGGVIVTESGKVSYLKDENGDGRVDRDEVWFTGFSEGNTQLRANHPRLGIDNQIYIANGLRGGGVVDHRAGNAETISINGMDFRFDPTGPSAQAISGVGQFGMTIDDWGNRFICSNRNPVKHVVIEDHYLKASPQVAVAAVAHDVAAFAEQSRVFPLSRAWTTSNLHAGQFTAACGVYVYRGDALPAEYRDNAFTCDPTGNLVHREIMRTTGPTFTSQPAYADREWLASPDEWFRPVGMEVGPDGALYVVDMYRAVIEHPEFMPDELKKRPDLRLGDDRGRIYRVAAKSWQCPKLPSFADADEAQLIAALNSPNGWQRDTAQRLLLERGFKATSLTPEQKASLTPEALARVLHFGPSDDLLIAALGSKDARVRRLAVKVSEQRLQQSPQLLDLVRSRLTDDNTAVRFQTLLTLTAAKQLEIAPMADAIKPADYDDPWMRSAIELAAGDRTEQLLVLLLKKPAGARTEGQRTLLSSLTTRSVALGKAPAAKNLLKEVATLAGDDANLGIAVLLLESIGRAGRAHGFALTTPTEDAAQQAAIAKIRAYAEKVAADSAQETLARREAIALLGHFADATPVLLKTVREEPNHELRQAAVTALANQSNQEAWGELLQSIGGITPSVRRAVLEASIGSPVRAGMLLDMVERGELKPAELDLVQANRLRQHRDAAVRDRALKLLSADAPSDRVEALQRYREALKLTGDANRGRIVFEKNCSTCHRVGDVGVNVAPDISDSRTKTAEQILTDIIQPNRAIDNNYIAYNVLLADGTNTTGILTNESTTSITLKQPGDKTIVVSRDDIEELRSSGVSLMPEGLEKNIDIPAMADLLAYIKNWRYLDGKTPLGN